jgi:SAM-dependent methyltransferase
MSDEKHDEEALLGQLKELYKQQVARGTIDYLKQHSNNDVIVRGHVRTFCRYVPFLKKGHILDWGCLHAPDSCMLRHLFGETVTLSGCDIYNVPGFEVFHQYAGLEFKLLQHPYELPYNDSSFDSVIGSGVIEHVAMPAESLKEIHRILKPDGIVVLTYMPSRYSLTEFALRTLKKPHHRRRFTVAGARKLLLDHGFIPERLFFHDITPTLSGTGMSALRKSSLLQATVRFMYSLNPLLERFYPVNRFGQNLMAIAKRADGI